jgi:hypothetical protein
MLMFMLDPVSMSATAMVEMSVICRGRHPVDTLSRVQVPDRSCGKRYPESMENLPSHDVGNAAIFFSGGHQTDS